MPFIGAGSLREWTKRENPSEEAIKKVCFDVLSGIAHLHKNGIIHCDLKCENVMIREDGTPVILDFDVSKDNNMRTLTINSQHGRQDPKIRSHS